MDKNMQWTGFLATILILVTLFIASIREPVRQAQAAFDIQTMTITEATEIYAQNCVVCHGASGEGMGVYPPLVMAQSMDTEALFRTIERGRYDTQMAAYGIDEGGILSNAQIDSLVNLIQTAPWQSVSSRVDELGLTPPQLVVAPIPDDTLQLITTLANGEIIRDGLMLYAENCTACHGANGEGSTLAPPLKTTDIQLTEGFELTRLIEQGVPGTLMAGWNNALNDAQVYSLVSMLQRWPELDALGIEIPVVEAKPIDMSPEVIAQGQRLFSIICTSCHGAEGFGTPMAPALNNSLFLARTSNIQMYQIISMGVSGTIMPAWSSRLNETDINAIVAYLRALEDNAPIVTVPR